ncbi:hypothetical protein QPK87_03945 [Kamptonema cortianum]|nr:hypothetical protein [Oscillatoria laete-virens]MDK3155731.1 hypothetical protein [Kamptonema cortianum]MDL5048033.1 hypothetical protein [Oscillatoria amoena NRMC-F 0135]MDL5052515.1 hypothetical protein [Oscillatoria laete-virens NRMC-F 0139]
MKLEQGDAFEKAHASWIRQVLPHYEPLWSLYIGHNGNGWLQALDKLTNDENTRRRKLYQAHYSAAFGCYQFEESLRDMEARLGEVKDIDSFMREHRHLYGMMGWVGFIRDMYKQMDEALSPGGFAYCQLQDFYALRSHIMHGSRMPIRIVDGLMQIPHIARQNKTADEWDDKSYWDEFKDAEFVFLADFCSSTKSDLFSVVRKMHAKIYSAACELFGDRRIEVELKDGPTFISASTAMPAISAWTPPSGDVNCKWRILQ